MSGSAIPTEEAAGSAHAAPLGFSGLLLPPFTSAIARNLADRDFAALIVVGKPLLVALRHIHAFRGPDKSVQLIFLLQYIEERRKANVGLGRNMLG